MKKKALGKGLSALLGDFSEEKIEEVNFVPIDSLYPNISQPRKNFDEESIKKLADSISKYGILQPLIVKKENSQFTIIAGERRWRAAKLANLNDVPVIVKENIDDVSVFEISLIENLQREDLNPIEEAESYKKLIEAFNYTHEKLAELIGKNRTYVTNSLRLLKLSKFVKDKLISGELSSGHGKILASLPEDKQNHFAKLILEKGLSVRELEKLIYENGKKKTAPDKQKEFVEEAGIISKKYNTKVEIKVNKKDKGKIIIHFKNKDELKKLLEELTC
jgi:ParB family chromosome partitioning protein